MTAVRRGRRGRFLHGHNATRLGITEADYSVEDRGHETPCWIWRHSRNAGGYGRVARRGGVALAHVAMYEQEVGPVPEGRELDHLCRVHPCVRPSHLEPVEHRENVKRGLGQRLSDEQVAAIRRDPRSSYAVAADYGITASYASKLKRGAARA